MKTRCNRQTGVTMLFCRFDKYNHALGCCGFAAVGEVLGLYNFREELK